MLENEIGMVPSYGSGVIAFIPLLAVMLTAMFLAFRVRVRRRHIAIANATRGELIIGPVGWLRWIGEAYFRDRMSEQRSHSCILGPDLNHDVLLFVMWMRVLPLVWADDFGLVADALPELNDFTASVSA
jgi:hypothetical protein